jgi:hypothetical protein
MNQDNQMLIECVLKIDEWYAFKQIMSDEKYEIISAKIYTQDKTQLQ